MNLQAIREQRAAHVTEMRAILAAAETEKRALTTEQQARFDELKSKIQAFEADEARATFLVEAERRMQGAPAGGGDRSFTALQSQVSVLDVLRAQMEGRALDGAAAEYNAEAERRSGRRAQGTYIPMAALETRVNTTGSAGDIVPTDHRPQDYVSPLRNALLARRLGVRVLSNLSGNVSIPRHGSGLTTGWVAEGSALTPSDMTFDSITLTPRHVGALTEMSRQLIQQSSPDIEALVREDLAAMVAQAIDSALIEGGGANEPSGILSSVGSNGGVQSGTLAGPTWAQVLEIVEQVESANALGSHSWLLNPAAKAKLRSTLKVSGDAGAGFLMDNGQLGGYAVHTTNQAPSDSNGNHAIFGDWSEVFLGVWAELDLLLNPYAETPYKRGGVLVRAMATCDVALRHPEAFVAAVDVPSL